MAIGPVVTRGYGSFGSVNLVVTRGYTPGEAATPILPIGGDDAWIKKQVRAYRKRLREWEQAEERLRRETEDGRQKLANDLQDIYERIVEGKEPASVIAATRAVAPYIEPQTGRETPQIDWSSLLDSAEAIKSLLRAYGERDKWLRRERARRRNAALTALLLDG